MSLSIKDPEAHRLAQAIAQETGQSMTKVVMDALRERHAQIERAKGKASIEEILAIGARLAPHRRQPIIDHADLLYDENGLPK